MTSSCDRDIMVGERGIILKPMGSHDTDPFAAQDTRLVADDIKTIRESLKAYRNIARQFRYGGLRWEWENAKKALEALDRIEKELKPKQTEMDI